MSQITHGSSETFSQRPRNPVLEAVCTIASPYISSSTPTNPSDERTSSAASTVFDVKTIVRKALKYMEINLLDHIIIAEDSFYSLTEQEIRRL
jgi:DNA repair protein RadC